MTTEATAREHGSAEPSSEETVAPASSAEAESPVAQTSGSNAAPDTAAIKRPGTSAVFEATVALPKILKIAGAVVAPTTMLTALLFYFGQAYANGSFEYFGVNFTVLDLTVQDYLIRSVDGLIIPLIIIAGAILLVLWIHQLLLRALPAGTRWFALRVVMSCAAITGLILVTLAIADVVGDPIFGSTVLHVGGGGVVRELEVDGSAGEHDGGQRGLGAAEAVGAADDQTYLVVQSFLAAV